MAELNAIYLLEPKDGEWLIRKFEGAECTARHRYDLAGCTCKGYKYRGTCTHEELIKGTYTGQGLIDPENLQKWQSIINEIFPDSKFRYADGRCEYLIKSGVKCILWTSRDDITFRLVFSSEFEKDAKEFL